MTPVEGLGTRLVGANETRPACGKAGSLIMADPQVSLIVTPSWHLEMTWAGWARSTFGYRYSIRTPTAGTT